MKEILPKRYSKPKKEVAAKVLREEGLSYDKIGELLGVSQSTAIRYAAINETPEHLKYFEDNFTKIIQGQQYEGLVKANAKLLELLPKERKISEVVKAGEYFKGGNGKTSNIQINIANVLEKDREAYDLNE